MSRAQSPQERRAAAAETARVMRQQQRAAARRRRVLGLSVLGVAVVALIAVAAFVLIRHARETSFDDIPLAEIEIVPSGALEDGGIPVSAAGVGVLDESVPRVDVYQDFICPGCASFESLNKAMLDELAESGAATVVYHPLATLDGMSMNTQYSTRAASAVALVADQEPESYLAFSESLFANQPAENSTGLTDAEIGSIARTVGVSDGLADDIEAGIARTTYGQWVYSATQSVLSTSSLASPDYGGFVTPTVAIDGERYSGDYSTETLREAILAG